MKLNASTISFFVQNILHILKGKLDTGNKIFISSNMLNLLFMLINESNTLSILGLNHKEFDGIMEEFNSVYYDKNSSHENIVNDAIVFLENILDKIKTYQRDEMLKAL